MNQEYSGVSLTQRLMWLDQELDRLLAELVQNTGDAAEAKYNYRVALAQKIWELREDRKVPVTIVTDLAKGDSEVALLMLKNERLAALQKALQEAVFVRQNQLSTMKELWKTDQASINR